MDEQQKKYKIMMVDDDKFLLEMYAKKFSNSGFSVNTATSGEEALDLIRDGEEMDILAFDMIMPQIDGMELLTAIQKENLIPTVTKIVLSNQGQKEDIDNAKELGVDGYIVKALHTPSEVVAEVITIHEGKLNK